MLHTTLVLGPTHLSFGLPLSVAQGKSVPLLIFTRGVRERGILGDHPEIGWKMQIFNLFSPFITAYSCCHK